MNTLAKFACAVLLQLSMVFSTARAQQLVTVRAVLQDSVTGRSVGNGVVELRGGRVNRRLRADANGRAIFLNVASGTYVMASVRVGYRPRSVGIVLSGRDTTVTIAMAAIPTELVRVDVSSNTQEIFGIVAGMPSLLPVSNALVELTGSRRKTTTDTAGNYMFRDLNAGEYVLRITATGFKPRMLVINLPRGTAVESSHLLDEGVSRTNALAGVWRDLDLRLAARGRNSAVVSAEELHKMGGSLSSALQRSRDVALKGLRISGAFCVFLDGRPMPNWKLDDINPDEVAMVEVYEGKADPTNLKNDWPSGVPCTGGITDIRERTQYGRRVSLVVVWTKR